MFGSGRYRQREVQRSLATDAWLFGDGVDTAGELTYTAPVKPSEYVFET